jgi:hypothetical protein
MRNVLVLLIFLAVIFSGCHSRPQVSHDKGLWTFSENQHPLLVYNHIAMTYKPYVVKLYTPLGINVLRDQVADHLHHHGLMLGWSVNGVNFWEETAACGYQLPLPASAMAFSTFFGDRSSRLSHESRWVDTAKSTEMLTEQRWIDTRLVPQYEAVLTTWTSVCSVPAGQPSMRIAGQHYYGLGMRFVQSMDNNGEFVYAGGKPGPIFRGDERLTEGAWCAYRSAVEGKPVTVAMFDDPGNPRPVTWFTMKEHFAYLSATMRLHEMPLEVTVDKPATLRYGIALWDGHRSDSDIETLYQDWLRKIKTSSK